MTNIKWYMRILLMFQKRKSVTDISVKSGTKLQTTIYYKTFRGHYYIVDEVYKYSAAKGKHNKRIRRGN